MAVFFDDDLYMPCTHYDDDAIEGVEIWKIVVKIPLKLFCD